MARPTQAFPRVFLSVLAGVASACALWPGVATGATAARPADDFIESIGVNTHLGYSNTPYHHHDVVEQKLAELGVRYIRDGLTQGKPGMYQTYRSLAARGVRANIGIGDPQGRWDTGPLEKQIALLKRELRGVAVSVEGPNEYDKSGDPNWVAVLRDYQRRFYHAVKSDPELAHLTVLGPSLSRDRYRELGDVSQWLDQGSLHPYPGAHPPEREPYMTDELAGAARSAGRKPIQVTETGYHNAVAIGPAFGHRPVDEHATGLYVPRLYLDSFARGIPRTFLYELLDEWPNPARDNNEASFGLLRNNFSEKPAFVALNRLIALLSDPGPRFHPGNLDFGIEAAPPGLRRLLLQKRDGTFYLALWDEAGVWDPVAGGSVAARGHRVRLVLGRRARQVEVYRPNDSERPLARRRNIRSLGLRVSPKVVVLKIAARGRTARSPLRGLKGKEQRVARMLLRLKAVRAAETRSQRRADRLEGWLRRRARQIRVQAGRSGWQKQRRRVRYRAIRRVLRAT